MDAQVKAWQDILTNTLQPKLAELEGEARAHAEAAQEYADLAITVEALRTRGRDSSAEATPPPLRAWREVEPGSDLFDEVEVPDTTRIHIDVGEGEFKEFPLDEALEVVWKRQKHFERLGVTCQEQLEKLRKDIWKGMSVVEQLQSLGL